MLAGISADYYLRLERGRDRNPSAQVLESIARVLHLDDDGTAYLMTLAADKPRRTRCKPRSETVPTGILKLLATFSVPAIVEGRYFDVLASNRMAVALSPRLAVGGNQLLDMFLDPAERALYPDWDQTTACHVASLRQSIGSETEDPRFIELAGELSMNSQRFRTLWNRHDVAALRGSAVEFEHPQVGALRLYRERLDISATNGIRLIVYHPEPGTEDADKLELLSMSTTEPADRLASPHRSGVPNTAVRPRDYEPHAPASDTEITRPPS